MLGPLQRWLTGCAYPFLPLPHRPSPKSQRVGCSTSFRSTTSERGGISRLQSFVNLQASEFAATQVVPTAENPYRMFRAAVAFTSEHSAGCYLPAHRICQPSEIGQMTAKVFHLLDSQPCRPLPGLLLPGFQRVGLPSRCWI